MGIKQLTKESRPQVDENMMLFIVLFIERQLAGSQEAIKGKKKYEWKNQLRDVGRTDYPGLCPRTNEIH